MNNFWQGFLKIAAIKPGVMLQPHQERVKERMARGQSLLLYHGLGSGKTLSSILATEQPGKKVDVVVPASLRGNYQKELEKFTKGKGPERNVTSYEGATKKGLPGGDFLVADEIQRINNPQAARSQRLIGAAPKYKQRLVLSGTPIRNAPYELAPVIRTINPEAKVPLSPTEFTSRFVGERSISPGFFGRLRGIKPGVESYAKNLPEIEKAVAGHVDYHMPAKEGYPSTSEQTVEVPMSEEQHKIYATVTDQADPIIAWKVRRNMPLSKAENRGLNAFMTAARIVSNTTAPYGGKEPSPKLARAAIDLKTMIDANPAGKALIYSNYLEGGVKEYAKHLDEQGIPYHVFTGELSDKERKKAVNDYNAGKVKALLISGAGSEGLDLKGTRLVQVLEPHWNKARIDQAVGRAVRYQSHAHLPEQDRHVNIVHYHSSHSPTLMNKLFRTKQDVGADLYLSNLSKKKDLLNQQFLDVLKAEGERATKQMEEEKGLSKAAFWQGFEKQAAEKTKSVYHKIDINSLDPKKDQEIWSVKIDGAHTVTRMQRGKLPLLFSHRTSKKTGALIPYTPKLPHIKTPSPYNAEVRTETYAVDKSGRAVHPDVVVQILNSGVDKSLELQKRLGIKTTSALIDVDKFEGKDMRRAPYGEKRKVMEMIAKSNPDFHLPDTAFTSKEKESLLEMMLSKKHPQSKEGLVVHDLNSPERPFTKAKIIDESDVHVVGIFKEEGVKAGRKPMAGGIIYSWDEGGKPVGKIGTGFNHAEKEDMLKNPDKYIGRVARVKALDLSKNKVLVKPSFSLWHVEKNL